MLVLYGAGKRCNSICEILELNNIKFLVVDSDQKKWNTLIRQNVIYNYEVIQNFLKIRLCITVLNDEIQEEIREKLYAKYKNIEIIEISYEKLLYEQYIEYWNLKKEIFNCYRKQNSKESFLFSSPNGLGLGGIEVWTIDVCKNLILEGVQNVGIISNEGEYIVPEIIHPHIHKIPFSSQNRFTVEIINDLLRLIISKLPCKIITSQCDDVLLASYIVKQVYPDMITIISVIHGGQDKIYNKYMSVNEYVDLFIGVSQEIRDDMIQRGINPNKILSMTCPFKCGENLNRGYTENKEQPIKIGYAGRMDGFENSQKRMDLLLKLVTLLDNKNIHFQMELAGDGPAKKKMQEYIEENGLETKVFFVGQLDRTEIPDFWKRQDIFINLADYEGRCISKLEAMANGAVPVTTNTVGTMEDIMEDINGYIVPIGNYEVMADKIEYLSEHRERLSELGKRAHDMIYPKSLMSEHIKFWKKVLEDRYE